MLPRRLPAAGAACGRDSGGRSTTTSSASTPLNPLYLPRAKLPLPCPILTSFLSGGLPPSSITELSGESSTGKTQFCLHLSAASTPSLYISTEPPFPLRRLRALSSPSSLDQVFVAFAHTPDDLLARLVEARRFPAPRVIVVDSVAAVFRAEFDNSTADMRKRAGLMFKIAAELKALAWRFGCAVVVTNQVVDVISDRGVDLEGWGIGSKGNAGGSLLLSSGREVTPALGLAWANCINTRLFLSREDMAVDVGAMKIRRRMRVVFAPHLPEQSCEFEIRKDGVFGLPPLLDRSLFGKVAALS